MIIGLTGEIGNGKSTVTDILKEYGYQAFICDDIANDIMMNNTKVYEDIIQLFGNEIIREDLALDKRKISDIVYKDEEMLIKLNKIIHPAVIDFIKNNLKPDNNYVIESAILFDTDLVLLCDKIIYVYTNYEERLKRLSESRNLSEEKIKEILSNQMESEDFKEKSDYVIDNSFSPSDTKEQLKKILDQENNLCDWIR